VEKYQPQPTSQHQQRWTLQGMDTAPYVMVGGIEMRRVFGCLILLVTELSLGYNFQAR
jgi:hypothetical protein